MNCTLSQRIFCAALVIASISVVAQTPLTKTQVVMLGTGTPYPDPDRSGPATAIIVNGTPYLVDCGPGVIRRVSLARKNGIQGITPQNLHHLFLTHLHSDHTSGLPDVMFTPSVVGRRRPLEIYGPKGTFDMVHHVEQAWSKDIDVRLHGLEKGHADAYVYNAHEVKTGVVYKDQNVTVTAIPVKHGTWDESWGYRFDTPDRSIVISGDTSPAPALAKACNGCDIFIHEVYPQAGLLTQAIEDHEYHRQFHTSTAQLAQLAETAKPKLLVLYHVLFWGVPEQSVIEEIHAAGYQEKIVSAHDLDVY